MRPSPMLDFLNGKLTWQVLPKGATVKHVEDLTTATDANNRQAVFLCKSQESPLETVAQQIHPDKRRGLSSAVPSRGYVSTARQEKEIKARQDLFELVVASVSRQNHGQMPAFRDRFRVVGTNRHIAYLAFRLAQFGYAYKHDIPFPLASSAFF